MKPGDIAEGKSCGECGLCCKLIGVESIAKPQFTTWCRHFKKSAGCGIYEDRPHDCRAFICYWLHVPNLGDAWRPDRAGFVMHIADGGSRLNVEVDPINPQAWKAEPFYSTFKTGLGDPTPASFSPLYRGQVLVHGLGASPDHRTLAVVSVGSNAVTFIDTATNAVRHMTNPARAAIVNVVGPVRQLVQGDAANHRRYLVIASGAPSAPGPVVQRQTP